MAAERLFASLMSMDEAAWERHASPWSVWTRVAFGLPLILGAVWSFHWLGWWGLAVLAAAGVLIWVNPRAFPPPASTDTWASRATFGERVWLNRSATPIPEHHARAAMILSGAAGIGFVIALAGAIFADLFWTAVGGVVSWFSKMWFCDRMVWLYADMRDADPRYRAWLR